MAKIDTIIFTGGGSGGHVVPALTLIEKINVKTNLNVFYVGGIDSVERELVSTSGIKYFPIHTGKLRRYFSFRNFSDLLKFIFGIFQSMKILFSFKRNSTLIFSTGGFVGLPCVVAGGLLGFDVYIHEQTSRVGLANKIASYFASKIFISFEESKNYFPREKTYFSGYPLKDSCFTDKEDECLFKDIKLSDVGRPILLVTGGGNGSKLLNDYVLSNLESIKGEFYIIHQVGKVFLPEFKKHETNYYKPIDFIDNITEVMKHSSLIISRSGAGTVMELIAIRKKSIFIPLKIAQKNEQYHNAQEAKRKLGSLVIQEDELSSIRILDLFKQLQKSKSTDDKFELQNGADNIIEEIDCEKKI